MAARSLAFCITELEVGGAERCLTQLALALADRGWRCAVFCLAPRPPSPGDILVRLLESHGVAVVFHGAKHSWQALRVARELERSLTAFQPDVVQCFLFHANILGSWAARRAGAPVVLTGIRVADRRIWHAALSRWFSALADRHVCVSAAVAEHWRERARISPTACVVIPNGVDVEQIQTIQPASLERFGIPAGAYTLLYVGRLDRQKGVDRLLASAEELLARCATGHLLVLGRGPLEPAVLRAVRTPRLSGRLHFLGWREDALTFVASGDLLLLPSRWEGMPNVLLEAMALGKPVVAFDAEGVAEALGPDAGVQRVPGQDMCQFLDAVGTLVQNRQLALHLGQLNQLRVRRKFDLAGMVDAYATLYEQLLRERA